MKVSVSIASTINKLPKGYVFTYADINTQVDKKEAIIKALNRMVENGKLQKLSKGKYFKPEETPFGNLQPNQAQVVKDLLESNGKIVGYLTGCSIYNQLGLTTQVSNTIQIGKNQIRPSFSRERYTIAFIQQKNIITMDNIPLLQLLDAIKYIKKIPDSNIANSCKRVVTIIEGLNNSQQKTMVKLAIKYPPATRALLGAILQHLLLADIAEPLRKSLNPISQYNLGDASKVISTTANWNIV